mgnify:CR=1 FL=1
MGSRSTKKITPIGQQVLDGKGLKFFSTRRTGGGTNAGEPFLGYRYVRWVITDLKNFSAANSVQVSEFVLRNNDADISMSGSSVTNPGGNTPASEGPSNLIDGSTSTKWLDFNIKNSPFTSTVIFDMGSATIFNGYRWATANDAEDRDPKSWTVSGSNDGTNYTTLHTVTGFTATSTRQAYQTSQSF